MIVSIGAVQCVCVVYVLVARGSDLADVSLCVS